jgi:hypothetical protein
MTLPDPATDPAGYVLAVADLREQRLAEVALWRGIAERHVKTNLVYTNGALCDRCDGVVDFPCSDLLGAVAAAKAYDQTKELG